MSAKGTPRRGLQSILTTQLLVIAAVVILANVAFVAVFDASDRNSLMIDVVRRELLRLEAAYLETGQNPQALVSVIDGIYAAHPGAYAFAVVASDGDVLDGWNAPLIPEDLLRPGAFATDWIAWPSGADVMPVVASHSVQGANPPVSLLFLMAGDPADLLGAEIFDEFKGHVWLPLLPIAILLIGGTLLIIRRALRPVAQAAEWARAIRPGRGLPPLDLPRAPTEVDDLTQAVRRSIERLDTELNAEQRRAAEAAHALRTPVAVLVARLDELPRDPAFDTLREDVRTLSRMVTQFLSSAGADRLELPEGTSADLSAIAERVVAELFPVAEARGCEIALSGNDVPVPVHGAPDAIALALTNLIENALHHAGPGLVEITVGPGTQIAVRDHGPGLPQGSGDLFEPFRRGAGAPRGGAGLGLAIVARIQRAHGGTVEASGAPGGGAIFRLGYLAPSDS
ncbi:sensor histidine kinase [Thetidibacter halocola]|uniref:histidine kinase n=1 Tax=Thetidibacter halocola TaxID=2827239 RepID=A0A8J7WHC6_9RHOB|nr:HAMP domain-containing sensor histidine kinase [Thetidibacter halocola]MBS0125676.1 HAMP domain-containing histidine kinase [Thetidibacter halocola]